MLHSTPDYYIHILYYMLFQYFCVYFVFSSGINVFFNFQSQKKYNKIKLHIHLFLAESGVTMGSAVERTDEHVREYLIYRGFTSTLKHLDSEIKTDKEKGFRVRLMEVIYFWLKDVFNSSQFNSKAPFVLQVDKIIDQLQHFIQNFDLFGLKEYWLYLDRRLFCRLEDVYRPTVNKLRTSLFRYYVINTIQVLF